MSKGELTKKDRLRIELAVRTVDWELDGRVPRARRRQLRDLKALAGSYLEVYRGRFDVRAGAFWAFVTYVAIQVLGFALFFAFHAGVVAAGSHGGSYSFEFWPGFGPFAGKVSASGNTFEVLLASPAHVLLVWVAFLIGSSYRTVFARRRT